MSNAQITFLVFFSLAFIYFAAAMQDSEKVDPLPKYKIVFVDGVKCVEEKVSDYEYSIRSCVGK